MLEQKNDYQQHIHVFRGVAIIFIVCAHTIPSLDWSENPVLGRVIDGFVNQSSFLFLRFWQNEQGSGPGFICCLCGNK